MRRTRHVVLPVRSWEHVGLMLVSLACLTLGLVSRDKEGQAGNLAALDLQHCAPHEVDACPNENALTRLLFYDDPATPSGIIRTDQLKKNRMTPIKNALQYSKNREEPQLHRDNRDSRLARRGTIVRTSRFDAGRLSERKDVRLSERRDDRRSRQTRDSLSLDRRSTIKNYRELTDRRNEQRTRQIQMSRSFERDSVIRNSVLVARRMNERDSSSSGYIRVAREFRDGRESGSFERRTLTRNIRLTTDRRNHRLIINREVRDARFYERNMASRSGRLETEHRDDRQSRQRDVQSLKRDSMTDENSRMVTDRLSQRREQRESRSQVRGERDSLIRNSRFTFEHRNDRSNRRVRDTRSLDRLASGTSDEGTVTGRKDDRLNRRIRDLRSLDRDSARTRNSRIVAERRERDHQRVSRSVDRDLRTTNSRVITERKEYRLSQQVRGIRSYERNSAIRDSRLVTERQEQQQEMRDFRSLEQNSDARVLQMSAERRNEHVNRQARERQSLNRESRTRNQESVSRVEERRIESLSRRIRDARSSRRNFVTGNLRLTIQRRDDEKNRRIRISRSLERELAVMNTRSMIEARNDRSVRNIRKFRSTERASTVRTSLINYEESSMNTLRRTRDVRKEFIARETRSRNPERSERMISKDRTTVRESGKLERIDRLSRGRQIADRRSQGARQVRENLVEIEKLGVERQRERLIREKRRGEDRDSRENRNLRTFNRVGARRQEKNYEPEEGPLTQRIRFNPTKILNEKISSTSVFEGLRQIAIIILCVVYGTSLYSNKGSISGNIITYANRFIIW